MLHNFIIVQSQQTVWKHILNIKHLNENIYLFNIIICNTHN